MESSHVVRRALLLGVCLTVLLVTGLPGSAARTRGPLRVCGENPRYFADSSGKAVYLTGSHTWSNLVDMGRGDPPPAFDYESYLNFMVARHHNFMRMWTSESFGRGSGERSRSVAPLPWTRTGSGEALDGKPKFDLAQFNQAYFDRLRSRVVAAGKRGIYVSVMLFCAWGNWEGHPFNSANNINGIDGDPDKTGKGLAVHTLALPAVTRFQEAYVRHVIDTVNDLDNVLYEITNESGPHSTEWQYHTIEYIKQYEATKPKRHPVGMTFQYPGGSNETLFASPADWISPNRAAPGDYLYDGNPPPADGRKVILADTDHLGGIWGTQAWVWESLCQGINPIFMDPYLRGSGAPGGQPAGQLDPKWDPVRNSMGYARAFAERMDLNKAKPMDELASSKFCLANPGQEYLIYLPKGGTVVVDLSAAKGSLAVEWFNPTLGKLDIKTTIEAGLKVELMAPFIGDAVLYLYRR